MCTLNWYLFIHIVVVIAADLKGLNFYAIIFLCWSFLLVIFVLFLNLSRKIPLRLKTLFPMESCPRGSELQHSHNIKNNIQITKKYQTRLMYIQETNRTWIQMHKTHLRFLLVNNLKNKTELSVFVYYIPIKYIHICGSEGKNYENIQGELVRCNIQIQDVAQNRIASSYLSFGKAKVLWDKMYWGFAMYKGN